MNTVVMTLYGDIQTDARVRRTLYLLERESVLRVVLILCDPVLSEPNLDGVVLPENTELVCIPSKRKGFMRQAYFIYRSFFIIKRLSPDIVFLNDYYSLPLIFPIKMKLDTFITYDSHELIVDAFRFKNIRKRIYFLIEMFSMRFVDFYICANRFRARIMANVYRTSCKPHVIGNGVLSSNCKEPDSLTIDSSLPAEFRANYASLSELAKVKKVVLYQGVISKSRELERFIELVSILPDEFSLVVIGSGPHKDYLIELATTVLESRFLYIPKIPYDHLGFFTSLADWGIVSYGNVDLNNKYCASNKMYEYFSSGIPVICTPNPPLVRELKNCGLGVVLSDNLAEVAKFIIEYKNDKSTMDNQVKDMIASFEVESSKTVKAMLYNAL